MFRERLSQISGRIDGAIALSLVARDGMPIESVSNDDQVDLETLAAELISQVKAISDQQRDLAVGEVQHFAVTTESLTLMLARVAPEFFLMLVLAADGSYGRARFELRRARLVFESDLA